MKIVAKYLILFLGECFMNIRFTLSKIKQLFVLACMFGCLTSLTAQENWTPVSPEQAEYNYLMENCTHIWCTYGGGSCSASYGAIFKYLKNIGTPTSLKVLKEQVAMGRVPACCLNNI